jgi:hypothetical protein
VCCPVQHAAARTHTCPLNPIPSCSVVSPPRTLRTGARVSVELPNPRLNLEGHLDPEHHPTIAPLAIIRSSVCRHHARTVASPSARTCTHAQGWRGCRLDLVERTSVAHAPAHVQVESVCVPMHVVAIAPPLFRPSHGAAPTVVFVPSTGCTPNLVAVFLPDTPSPALVHLCTSASRC